MEKRDRKPGYFARLKRRRQLKQNQSEKNVNEQNPAIISCPEVPNDSEPNKKTDLQRITAKPPAGSDDGCKSKNLSKREKRKPPGTMEFIVGPNDSLNSIALNFNITPNKLVQLNKLFSRSVYPGQKLFVPDVSQSEADLKAPGSSDPSFTNGVSENVSHDGISNCMSAKALRRELSPNSEDESPATVKFIKMSCKYFTDGMGVVGGVLIVTPNNIMFDPHKSDPLVIEHGCEEYGLICPMEEVVSVALYDDVSRMKLKDALPSDLPQDLCPVYRPGEWEQLPSERDLNPFSRYEALDPKRPIVLDDIESTLSETGSTECEQADKSPSDEGFTELEPTVNRSTEEPEGTTSKTSSVVTGDQQELGPSCPDRGDFQDKSILCQTKGKLDDEEDEGVAQNSSIEDGESVQSSSETEKQSDKPTSQEETETKDMKSKGTEELLNSAHDKMSVDQNRKLSLLEASEVHGISSPTRQSPDRPAGGAELSEEERRKKNYEAEVKSWLLERMQAPIEDMLFSSEEKSKNPPMFLCFKVGKPMRKSFASGMTSSPAHSFGGRGKQPEYWFECLVWEFPAFRKIKKNMQSCILFHRRSLLGIFPGSRLFTSWRRKKQLVEEDLVNMESGRSDSGEGVDRTCIFCLIANDQDKETEIIKKDKELMCFRDIYPAAPHHYLVIPIQHIESCHSLHWGHIGLIQRMAEMGKAVLREQGVTDMKDIRLGFHQPPYTSVDHLHLHVLAPSSQISKYMEYKFIPQSYRFLTDDELLCFRDIKPGSTHHYLVITRTHIDNCKSLQADDIPLVERMVEMGKSVLEKKKVSDLDDVRMGFHLPPLLSVPHLHLHALAPASTMKLKSQLRYGPQSHWFITVDKVLSQLKTRGKVK